MSTIKVLTPVYVSISKRFIEIAKQELDELN